MALHPNLVDHWFEFEADSAGDTPQRVLVLKTNVPLDPKGNDFDSGVLADMITALAEKYNFSRDVLENSKLRITTTVRSDA